MKKDDLKQLNNDAKFQLLELIENTSKEDNIKLKDFLIDIEKNYLQKDFTEILNIDKNKYQIIKEYTMAYGGLVKHIRNCESPESNHCIGLSEKIWKISTKENFTERESVLIKQWKLSCDAYYFYINSNYERAIKLTKLCLFHISELIVWGLNSFFFRYIEQHYNLAKIYIKKGDITNCISSINFILKCLFDGRILIHDTVKHDIKPHYTDTSILSFFSIQYFGLCIKIYSQLRIVGNKLQDYRIYNKIFSGVNLHNCPAGYELLQKWLVIKQFFFKGNHIDFLINFTDFIFLAKDEVWVNFKISLVEDFTYIVSKKKINSITIKGILKSKNLNCEDICNYILDNNINK
ncbi:MULTISPECIES: hypothetical protein [Sphingobacterium]|uniref:hypothetical protein n=1 Tax=Sphingobacterium TaxID=28453 RepID=UPI00257C5976|nr:MULTISPECIES: hypothetical protein [Sphingobacterium]